MTLSPISRREVLAALGLGAVGATAGQIASTRPPYRRYTYAKTAGATGDELASVSPTESESDGHRVRVAWFEKYNGTVVETQRNSMETNVSVVLDPSRAPTYVDGLPGSVITLGNVLPGDRGRLGVGISVESVDAAANGVALWYRLRLTENCENGTTEPEMISGDRLPDGEDCDPKREDVGELADVLAVRFWEDTSPHDACDGSWDVLEPNREGSLADLDDELAGGIRLGDGACLQVGETRCLGFRWELPTNLGNGIQTDSVAFDLEVVPVSCDEPNPFAEVDA